MTAALSMADPLAEAWGLFGLAQEMTNDEIRRLTRLEDGAVRVTDRIEETRAAIERGQQLQIDALKLIAQLKGATP